MNYLLFITNIWLIYNRKRGARRHFIYACIVFGQNKRDWLDQYSKKEGKEREKILYNFSAYNYKQWNFLTENVQKRKLFLLKIH